MKKISLKILLIYIFLAPILCSLMASSIASFFKCESSGGGPLPCVVMGKDIGGVLYGMFFAHWVSVFFALIAVPIFVIRGIVLFIKNKIKN